MNSLTPKHMLRYTVHIMLQKRSEVKKWPPRGLKLTPRRSKWKDNAIFEFLAPKNICLDTHHATKIKLNFYLLSEVRSQKVTSKGLNWISWHLKPMFWYTYCYKSEMKILTSGQRSKSDLQEVKMKKKIFADLNSLTPKT